MTRLLAFFTAVALVLAPVVPAHALGPTQQAPTRIYSIGDSITRAFDADLPADNLHLSWVNGTHGFLSALLGFPNVQSHHQRVVANFGSAGVRNQIAAQNGNRVGHMVTQASGMSGDETYVTILVGGNDVCKDTIDELPTNEAFAYTFAEGLIAVLEKLEPGATVQVAAIPDVKRLYEIGTDKKALGVVDCSLLWQTTALGFPCGSMLSPANSEADREYVQERNVVYNQIMHFLTLLGAHSYPHLYVSFTDVTYTFAFTQEHVSNIDCYHPSADGQALISEGIWDAGFFSEYDELQ
ncbi:MAG: SGNH/GDSL hydrolase family protein [Candidatus Binatia bacterium]|nr:SGNH/GDSL hydrolase family protein [Candidatus Binatia bacterium]